MIIASTGGFYNVSFAQLGELSNSSRAENFTAGNNNATTSAFVNPKEINISDYKGFSKFSGAGQTTLQPAESFTINWTKEAPELSQEVLNELENRTSEANSEQPVIQTSNETIESPKTGTETNVQEEQRENASTISTITKVAYYQKIAMQDFHIYRDDGNIQVPYSSLIGEPAVANAITNNGELILYSANHFAAKSTDHGRTWSYATPSGSNPDSFNGVFNFDLCCDQDVIYDAHNRIFIWYMQGEGGTFRLSVSRDLEHWNSWNAAAQGFDSNWRVPQYARLWWDYPQLALTNNNLFIATNVMIGNAPGNPPPPECGGPTFGCGPNDYSHTVVLRFNLGQLSQGLHPIPVSYFYDQIGFGLAEGARDEMFIGAHLANNQIRVIGWNDAGGFREADIPVPAWNHLGATNCTISDGSNPCASIGYQIHSGWTRGGQVGFFWNVGADENCNPGQTTCFPYPHVDAATFSTNNLQYIGRPYLWHPDFAWIHAFGSPTDRGLGVVAWKVGGTAAFPSINAGIDDDFNGEPPDWEMHAVATGNAATIGSSFDRLGDYLRVRPFGGGTFNFWIGSGYIVSGRDVIHHEFVFGREADEMQYRSLLNTVPDCTTASPSQSVLWPPNHMMISITIQNIIDPDGDPLTIRITSISQNEPTARQGMGDQSPDGSGIGTSTAQVRAERAGNGDGRLYHIRFTANDGRGAECTGEVHVSVPHDQGGAPARDSGARFDSTQ